MVKDTSLQSSPQLALVEQQRVVVALSPKQVVSLYKKSQYSEISFDILKEVYQRGYAESLSEQKAFDRVNSFIYGGKAAEMDKDLTETVKEPSGDLKSACWKGYTAVGMKMKNGRKVPNCVPKEEYTGAEKVSKNSDDASSRFVGTDSLTDVYKKTTPGYASTIKRVVKEQLEEDAKGYKNPTGGLTQKGRDHYNRESGGHLKAPVTTPPSKLKKGSKAANRRKSFCARMGGVEGPMRKPNGEPTRKALALRKWNC
jgi:hypothetical protein